MTPSPTDPIRVLIVDDHHVVRLGLRSLLSHTGGFRVVGEAGSVAESVQMAAQLTPERIERVAVPAVLATRAAPPGACCLALTPRPRRSPGPGSAGTDPAPTGSPATGNPASCSATASPSGATRPTDPPAAWASTRACRGGTASRSTSARLPAYRSATARANRATSGFSTRSGETTLSR